MKNLPLFPEPQAKAGGDAEPPGASGMGRDEMNLAEFPLVLLADRVPADLQSRKTLRYQYSHGTLVVSGSDAYGLPMAADADVLVGLLQLTRQRNDFRDPRVPFSRYELLKVLRWPDEGKSYRRLEESLNRWCGVTLYFENTWWDNRAKKHLSAKLHVIESIVTDDSARGRSRGRPNSYFVWNQTFIESCQADNLKRLDLDFYFGLKSAVSKRLYRFLDKRFYRSPDWEFDLRDFAIESVGLSRNYASNAGKIKEKLQPALDELEAAGFLEPLGKDARYRKKGRDWSIRLRKRSAAKGAPPRPAEPPAVAPGPPSTADLLIGRGVTARVAAELARDVPAERIAAKLDLLDWLAANRPNQVQDPGAWLVRAILDDYAPPKGYEPKSARDARVREAEEAKTQEEGRRRRSLAERSRRDSESRAIEDYWDRLNEDERRLLEAEVLARGDLDQGVLNSPLRRSYVKMLRDQLIRARLFSEPVA